MASLAEIPGPPSWRNVAEKSREIKTHPLRINKAHIHIHIHIRIHIQIQIQIHVHIRIRIHVHMHAHNRRMGIAPSCTHQ